MLEIVTTTQMLGKEADVGSDTSWLKDHRAKRRCELDTGLVEWYKHTALCIVHLTYAYLTLFGHNHKYKKRSRTHADLDTVASCRICYSGKPSCKWVDCPHVFWCMECYERVNARGILDDFTARRGRRTKDRCMIREELAGVVVINAR